MRNYYFNATKAITEQKLIVVGERRFETIQEKSIEGWDNLWLSAEAGSLEKAKEHFRKDWIDHRLPKLA